MDRASVLRRLDGSWRRGSEFPGARDAGLGAPLRRTAIDGGLESVAVTAARGVGIVTRARPAPERVRKLVSPALALSITGKRPGAAEPCSPAQA
ncbi:MAG: hypothetical protein V3R55_02315 [Alphaproteobacteria bacterium]